MDNNNFLRLLLETSERSDSDNWVKKELVRNGIKIISFEGYTLKNNLVTALFDRRNLELIVNNDPISTQILQLIRKEHNDSNVKQDFAKMLVQLIKEEEGDDFEIKLNFANRLGIHYNYVIYSYYPQFIANLRFPIVYDGKEPIKYKTFDSFCHFISQTAEHYRDQYMTSSYQSLGLPEIDKIFRDKCKIPWMGNLDAVLVSKSKKAVALIEFQTTIKKSVKEHCNNTFFMPTRYRKGDEERWKVMDMLSKHSNLPIIIIVWSPNEYDKDIKFKLVERFVFSDQTDKGKPGIYYKEKKLVTITELVELLKELCDQ